MKKIGLLFIFIFSFLRADPLIVKGADGEYIPVLAKNWKEIDGGIRFSLQENVDGEAVRTALAKILPNMLIEASKGSIFFPNSSSETLFPKIGGIETGIELKLNPLALIQKKDFDSQYFSKDAGDEIDVKVEEDTFEAVVESVEFDGKAGAVKLNVNIRIPAQTGEFKKLRSIRKIIVNFVMKENEVDTEHPENISKLRVLMAKPKSLVIFRIASKEIDGSYKVSDIFVRKF